MYRHTADTLLVSQRSGVRRPSNHAEFLGSRDFIGLRVLAFHAQKAPSLQIPGASGARALTRSSVLSRRGLSSERQSASGWNDGTSPSKVLACWLTLEGRTATTGAGHTPDWLRQPGSLAWPASTTRPGQASDTGDSRLALNWGALVVCGGGRGCDGCCGYGAGGVGISSSTLNCKRQHWPSARTIVFPLQPVPLLILVQQLRVFSEWSTEMIPYKPKSIYSFTSGRSCN
ncbi:uncharacterized protein K444DRAFT_233716 [Hyaloscypha bicolor E]|uniref:Uncharacterized protein n=1 Tax=Hyaloscypha bicolor E TaxID=1095630 RepID=A0A2J6SL88_9HELO|nr:uncharacterized protein K444DRAFT_233716 [Hyaloscypha bicolor E]PMD51528.1 hypothetical protein K444DRAFT_233716 [Hyaloscypha bicolor E]